MLKTFGRIFNMIISVFLALCVVTKAADDSQDIFSTEVQSCNVYEGVVEDYRHALYEFAVQSYKNAIAKELGQFVISPLSVWIDLATIAEGADLDTKLAMFKFLNLPLDPCTRLKYYQLATSRYASGDDAHISNTRALVIDEGVTINSNYHDFVFKYSLLDVVSAPIRNDPKSALQEIRRVASAKLPNLDLSGNSIIVDSLDYNGFWSTAFEDAITERSPFYSGTGELIGTVDLMKTRRRVRRTYFRKLNIKAIEIPVGYNDRYRMIFAMVVDQNILRAISPVTNSIIIEFLNSFEESSEPIDIAVPQIKMNTEYDLRKIMEEFGIKNIWSDSVVTSSISTPAALPSGFVQRSTISLDKAGLKPAPPHNLTFPMAFDPEIGPEFIANKPLLFALFDAETYTCLFAAAFRDPSYTD